MASEQLAQAWLDDSVKQYEALPKEQQHGLAIFQQHLLGKLLAHIARLEAALRECRQRAIDDMFPAPIVDIVDKALEADDGK